MSNYDSLRAERLNRTEATLRSVGCEKCNSCNYFMDKDFIASNGLCNSCNDTKVLQERYKNYENLHVQSR
jgi:hypothetical protein